MNIKNIKYLIFQRLCLIFPSYFKKRTFSNLKVDIINRNQKIENELFILHHILTENSTIIDVGANNGLYCYYFDEVINSRKIYAFEPIPLLSSKLKKWFPKVEVFPFAASDINSTKKLHIPFINSVRYDTRAKLDDLKETNENSYIEIEIKTKTIDSIFDFKNESVDFIKIDIEGHELAAVKGARNLIIRDKPVLMIEIEARHHNGNISCVTNYIENLGYNCYYFDIEYDRLFSFDNYKVDLHQSENQQIYINNFFFFPIGKLDVDKLNIEIQQQN